MKIERLVVKSSGAPALEVDHEAGAACLRFKRGKVARTIHRGGTGAFVAVDAPNTDFSRLNCRPVSLVPA